MAELTAAEAAQEIRTLAQEVLKSGASEEHRQRMIAAAWTLQRNARTPEVLRRCAELHRHIGDFLNPGRTGEVQGESRAFLKVLGDVDVIESWIAAQPPP